MAAGQGPLAGLDPARFDQIPVLDLLRHAAQGWIGIDKRLLKSIVDRGDAAAAEVLAFSRESDEHHRVPLYPLLVDLFRHFRTAEALEFFIDAIRREPEEVDDSLIQALLPFGHKAVDPLLELYEELGEEHGSDIAFVLAGLHVRDPRILDVLRERLEFDAADGAFVLGLYGDPAARPALEKMLAEVPEEDVELRREIGYALEQLDAPQARYEREPFDIYEEYPDTGEPAFDLLPENERVDLLASSSAEVRAGAAYSFFNAALSPKARAVLFDMARSDSDVSVRARAWEALSDAADDETIRSAMLAVFQDPSRPVEERGGAAVGLYPSADQEEVSRGLQALYQEGGHARAKALEAMWRSLYRPFARYFGPHLQDQDPAIVHQALRGAGYFKLTLYTDQIANYFSNDDFREDALFAYALAMPGETTRGRVRGMLRKIDSLAQLDATEGRLVMFALDERLRLQGLAPVFDSEEEDQPEEEEQAPAPPVKVSRNDPCPCGSGKKYKKCHGALQ